MGAKLDTDAIERNYQETLDLLMKGIRPTVQVAFNDMLICGRGGIIFDSKGARAIRPDEWEPAAPTDVHGGK